MPRKDYIALAAALKSVQPWSVGNRWQHMQDVRAIAEALAADNPRFDYVRFYEAAGFVKKSP